MHTINICILIGGVITIILSISFIYWLLKKEWKELKEREIKTDNYYKGFKKKKQEELEDIIEDIIEEILRDLEFSCLAITKNKKRISEKFCKWFFNGKE